MAVHAWELEQVARMSTTEIKNHLWAAGNGTAWPGNVSVEALRAGLIARGEAPVGFHGT